MLKINIYGLLFCWALYSCTSDVNEFNNKEKEFVLACILNCSDCYTTNSSIRNRPDIIIDNFKTEEYKGNKFICKTYISGNDWSGPDYVYIFKDLNGDYLTHFVPTDEYTIYKNYSCNHSSSTLGSFNRNIINICTKIGFKDQKEFQNLAIEIIQNILKMRRINSKNDLQEIRDLLDTNIADTIKQDLKQTHDYVLERISNKNMRYYYAKDGIGGIWEIKFSNDGEIEMIFLKNSHFRMVFM